MRTRGVLLLTLPLAVACWAETPETAANEPETAFSQGSERITATLSLDAAQQSGREVFETMCWTCHGSAGRGDGPAATAGAMTAPPNFLVGEYPNMDADDFQARFSAALAGEDDTHPHMRFVTSILKPDKFADALSYIPALTYPRIIPGSAIAGGALYETRCMACHGAEGRGDGPAAASLVSVQPTDFTQDPLIASQDWGALFSRIREGGQGRHTSMPPWGVVFTDAQMWDLVAFIGSLQPGVFAPLGEGPLMP
jgi:mono/diheme cytochrome c family protein